MLSVWLRLSVAMVLCLGVPSHAKDVPENFNTSIRFIEGTNGDSIKDYYKSIGFVFANSEYWFHLYEDPQTGHCTNDSDQSGGCYAIAMEGMRDPAEMVQAASVGILASYQDEEARQIVASCAYGGSEVPNAVRVKARSVLHLPIAPPLDRR